MMNILESGTWQVITSEEEFLALEADWNRLFLSNPSHRPFQAWGWVAAWIRHLAGPHELRIQCWRNDAGELQFVLPLLDATGNGRYHSPRVMAVCGYGPECSDYTSCLRVPDFDEQAAEITAACIERLDSMAARIELAGLDGSADYALRIFDKLDGAGRIARLTEFAVCPAVAIGDSWDAFLKTLSSNFRAQIRRHFKRITNHETLGFRTVQPTDAEQFAEQLIRLNRDRIGEKGKTSSLEDPDLRSFLMDAIPYMTVNGLARMDVIEEEGKIVAAALNLMHGNCVYFYMGGFDREVTNLRPGTALFARVIMDSIESGYTTYDFLRGADQYKYRWGAVDNMTFRLDAYPPAILGGHVAKTIDSLVHQARLLARRLR